MFVTSYATCSTLFVTEVQPKGAPLPKLPRLEKVLAFADVVVCWRRRHAVGNASPHAVRAGAYVAARPGGRGCGTRRLDHKTQHLVRCACLGVGCVHRADRHCPACACSFVSPPGPNDAVALFSVGPRMWLQVWRRAHGGEAQWAAATAQMLLGPILHGMQNRHTAEC